MSKNLVQIALPNISFLAFLSPTFILFMSLLLRSCTNCYIVVFVTGLDGLAIWKSWKSWERVIFANDCISKQNSSIIATIMLGKHLWVRGLLPTYLVTSVNKITHARKYLNCCNLSQPTFAENYTNGDPWKKIHLELYASEYAYCLKSK